MSTNRRYLCSTRKHTNSLSVSAQRRGPGGDNFGSATAKRKKSRRRESLAAHVRAKKRLREESRGRAAAGARVHALAGSGASVSRRTPSMVEKSLMKEVATSRERLRPRPGKRVSDTFNTVSFPCACVARSRASPTTKRRIITMAAMVTCVLFTLLPPTPLVPLHSHTRAPSPILRVQKEPSQPAAPTFELPAILQPELAIGGGMLLLTLLVGNRLFTEDLLNSQSRADLIATVAPVLIILKALGDLDITPKEADPVPPVGVATAWVEPSLPSAVQSELQWAAESVLIPPCTAAALWRDGRTLMLQGTLPSASAADPASCVKPGLCWRRPRRARVARRTTCRRSSSCRLQPSNLPTCPRMRRAS